MRAKPQYFVSYCRKDKEFVLRLVNTLRDSQVNVWLDQSDIRAGEPWDTKVQEALEKCDGVIVILSPRSVKSRNVLNEIGYAEEANKSLIPVVYEKCVPPLRLIRLHRIDLTGEGDEGLKELVKCLRLGEPLPQTAHPGLDTSTMPFSVEDVVAFLSMAPRKLIKQLVAAAVLGKWHDRLNILIILKGPPPSGTWIQWGSLLLAIGAGLALPEGRVFFAVLGAACILSILGGSYYQRYLRRLRDQMVGLTLAPLLPHRPPGEADGQRTSRLWAQAEPILWEIVALPADSWGEYLETIRADEELRHQVMALLSIFTTSTYALRKGEWDASS